ncbi:MAG: hypothetical protein Kow0091_15710 [Geminocystis sp.]
MKIPERDVLIVITKGLLTNSDESKNIKESENIDFFDTSINLLERE